MNRKFILKNSDIFKNKNIEIEIGISVLVGCNGIGKSTLLHQIAEQLKEKEINVISFDNLQDGGDRARSKADCSGDVRFIAQSLTLSEGEFIALNLERFAGNIGQLVRKCKTNKSKELWILLDAIDSGLSIDNIIDIKNLLKIIIEDCKGMDVYIIVSANMYELASGEKCFDVREGKYIKFDSYEEYRKFVLDTKVKM